MNQVEKAIEDIRQGRMVIVVDDEHRENEGDLVMAAEKVTPEAVNFMVKEGRGLVCVPMLSEDLDRPGPPPHGEPAGRPFPYRLYGLRGRPQSG